MPATRALKGRTGMLWRAAAVGTAVLAAAVVWLIAVPVLGRELSVESWDGTGPLTVTAGMVVATALAAGLAGWALLAVLERLTARPRVVWTATASVVLVASLAMPATAAVDAGTAVALGAMHAVVGAVLIPILARRPR